MLLFTKNCLVKTTQIQCTNIYISGKAIIRSWVAKLSRGLPLNDDNRDRQHSKEIKRMCGTYNS